MNKITLNEDQLFWMFRYCLSRKTYAVADGADAIITNWNLLSLNTKKMIKKEINNVYDMLNDCDRKTWGTVLALDTDENQKKETHMNKETARGLAAQAWCTPSNENKEMDTELAEAFADILLREVSKETAEGNSHE